MDIRKGSVVTIRVAEANGPGSQDSSQTNASVIDITEAYISATVGTNTMVYPWSSVRWVQVTTF